MEIFRDLDQQIDELDRSAPEYADRIDTRVDQIIDNLAKERIALYMGIYEQMEQLLAEKKLNSSKYLKTYKKLSQACDKELQKPLEILVLDEKLNFTQQYEREIQTLQDVGLMHTLESGELGITARNKYGEGSNYALPDLKQIASQIMPGKLRELPKRKEQGFTRLLITPFAIPIRDVMQAYHALAIKKQSENSIFDTDGLPLKITQKNSTFIVSGPFGSGETKQFFSYYPTFNRLRFNKLNNIAKESLPPFNISFVEDLDEAIKLGEAQALGGRTQISDWAMTPYQYIQVLRNYENEIGFTAEDWLALAISKLANENIQINTQTHSICTGTYLPMNKSFPLFYATPGRGVKLDCLGKDMKDNFPNQTLIAVPRTAVRVVK